MFNTQHTKLEHLIIHEILDDQSVVQHMEYQEMLEFHFHYWNAYIDQQFYYYWLGSHEGILMFDQM